MIYSDLHFGITVLRHQVGIQYLRSLDKLNHVRKNLSCVSKEQFTSEGIFTVRCSYASAVLGVVILSVCPSVRPSVTRVLRD